MFLIGIFGFLFGLLSWWRNSLRQGHDPSCVARSIERNNLADAQIASVYAVFTHACFRGSDQSIRACPWSMTPKISN